MLDEIVSKAPLFLLVSARCAALLFTLPLFSMRTVPKAAKIALAGYMKERHIPCKNCSGRIYGILSDGEC